MSPGKNKVIVQEKYLIVGFIFFKSFLTAIRTATFGGLVSFFERGIGPDPPGFAPDLKELGAWGKGRRKQQNPAQDYSHQWSQERQAHSRRSNKREMSKEESTFQWIPGRALALIFLKGGWLYALNGGLIPPKVVLLHTHPQSISDWRASQLWECGMAHTDADAASTVAMAKQDSYPEMYTSFSVHFGPGYTTYIRHRYYLWVQAFNLR